MNITQLKLWTRAEQQMPGICQWSWPSLTGCCGASSTWRALGEVGGLQRGLWMEHFDLELLCNELPLILCQVC